MEHSPSANKREEGGANVQKSRKRISLPFFKYSLLVLWMEGREASNLKIGWFVNKDKGGRCSRIRTTTRRSFLFFHVPFRLSTLHYYFFTLNYPSSTWHITKIKKTLTKIVQQEGEERAVGYGTHSGIKK